MWPLLRPRVAARATYPPQNASLNRPVVGDAHLDLPLLNNFRMLSVFALLYERFRSCAILECHVRERTFTDGVDVDFCVRCSVRRSSWLHKKVIPNPRYYKHSTEPKNSFHRFYCTTYDAATLLKLTAISN